MTTYLALLRGINVGGKQVRMEDLRREFTALGYGDVRTYIQTGNVIFTADGEPAKLTAEIEAHLAAGLGLKTMVLLRTGDDLATVVAGNPFADGEPDPKKLHVTFLDAVPDPERVGAVVAPEGETGRFAVVGREVYLHCPDGYGTTKLSNAFFEKRLGVAGTTRNWRVTMKLGELLRS